MLTATLFILFAIAAMIALAVLADASLRGTSAYRALNSEHAKLARGRQGGSVMLSVWTKEHAPSRRIMVERSPELVAA